MKWPWSKKNNNPLDLFENTGVHHPGYGKYKPIDKYTDFRQLFMGSEQGKRVFHEIMAMGHMFMSSIPSKAEPDYKVWINEGERRMALKIMTVINAEPADPPSKTNK